MQGPGEGRIEGFGNEAALATPADTGHTGKTTQGKLYRNLFEIMVRDTLQPQAAPIGLPPAIAGDHSQLPR